MGHVKGEDPKDQKGFPAFEQPFGQAQKDCMKALLGQKETRKPKKKLLTGVLQE